MNLKLTKMKALDEIQAKLQLAQNLCVENITKGRIGIIIDMLNQPTSSSKTILSLLEIAVRYTTDTLTAGRLQIIIEDFK